MTAIEAPVVATAAGAVSGEMLPEGVAMFRGVPFAGSIGAARRLRPAAPVERWDGVRPATRWPAPVPQLADPNDTAFRHHFTGYEKLSTTEDSLALNLWTPTPAAGADLPVLVWLHGGGFVSGEPTRTREDGRRLAQRGIVVVAPTHRLGPLGYLDLHRASGGAYPEASAGIDDLVRALEWVAENVTAFGGDPGNVTIMGESGGAAKVHTLLAVPQARALFRKGILLAGATAQQSGLRVATPDEAASEAGDFLRVLELDDPAAFADLPLSRVLDAQQAFAERHGGMSWRPTVDGELLTDAPWRVVRNGEARDVPLIVGCSSHELDIFGTAGLPGAKERLGGAFDTLMDRYRATRSDEHEAEIDFLGDDLFRIPGIRLAEDQAIAGSTHVYQYLFDYEYRSTRWPEFRATHGSETSFVFDRTRSPQLTEDDDEAEQVAARVSAAFAAFIATGTPGFPGAGEGVWPTYDVERRATAVIGRETRIVDDPSGDDRRLWDEAVPR